MIQRRDLVGLAAGAAVGWPLGARAQEGLRRLGVLMGITANDPDAQPRTAALLQGLAALGWQEGANLRIDWRWPGDHLALFKRYAAELVSLGPDVLLTTTRVGTEELRRQTRTIPIVFVNVSAPVEQGFVASLARPGGNITGFSNYDPPMAGKWLGMLTQLIPPVAHVAVLYNHALAPAASLLHGFEEAAQSLAVSVRAVPVKDEAEIEAAMAMLAQEERGGMLVMPDPFTNGHRDTIIALAARYRVPAVYRFRLFAVAGGLMSYGVETLDLYRRSAAYVDRILKGAKPSNLPVQAPTKFELVINLKTAKALGVTFPPSLVAGADEVIE